jgi:hypothetical protein
VAKGFPETPFFVERRDDGGNFQFEPLRVWRK